MKVASTVILFFKDSDGFSFALPNALHPPPNSSLRRLEESLELPLDQYGIKDLKAHGDFIHFIDTDGSYQNLCNTVYTRHVLLCLLLARMEELGGSVYPVPKNKAQSVMLMSLNTIFEKRLDFKQDPPKQCNIDLAVSMLILEKYEPATLVCALTKVLTEIRDSSSAVPTLIVPFVGMSSKLKWDSKTLIQNDVKASHHSVQIGPETEIIRAVATRTQKPPASLQIYYEPLACFLHLVRVLNLPTAIIIGKRGQGLSDKAAVEELEILYEMGELLENTLSLSFLREKITWTPANTTKVIKEPWRALYG